MGIRCMDFAGVAHLASVNLSGILAVLRLKLHLAVVYLYDKEITFITITS